ncbi:hypothetical protein AHF37_03635, partial [Paragonimus kellicotti]
GKLNGASNVGQNVAAGRTVELGVREWLNESGNYNFATNTCKEGAVCQHYTHMVSAEKTQIGCGAASCHSNVRLTVCNYGPGRNLLCQPHYKANLLKCSNSVGPTIIG